MMVAMTELTNEQLIPLAQSGDVAARQALIGRNVGVVLMVALKRLRGWCADELLADAAFYVDRSIDRFDPDRGVKFSTFCGASGRLLVLEECARMKCDKRMLFVPEVLGAAYDVPVESCGQCVRHAMTKLPERTSCIMWLRVAGMTFQTVGDMVGVCRERVRQIQRDAVQFLRTDLRNWCSACREAYAERN